ncbi:MAG: UPF0104 family protein [Solirubrobacterales bacterium]|nr:UPF0104 family protein [Solirubrobacterales bacterium]
MPSAKLRRPTVTRRIRSARWLAVPAIAVMFLAVPPVAGIPGRLIAGCAEWIALAGALELLSVLGFVLVFSLVFGLRMTWRQNLVAGLRAVGATSLLPAGSLVGPALGARSTPSLHTWAGRLTRGTVAFALITMMPGVIVLGAVGLLLWLGWLPGPHDAGRTLPAVAAALGVIAAVRLIRPPAAASSPRSPAASRAHDLTTRIAACLADVRDGVDQTRRLLAARNWKLVGGLGYYVFDNAVLWAAFHAYGRTPPLSVIVMGYLAGSLGSAVPLPAGLGAVEGGLIGALVLYGAPVKAATGAVLLYRGISLLLPVGVSACAWAAAPAANLGSRLVCSRASRILGAPSARSRRPRLVRGGALTASRVGSGRVEAGDELA